jgi:hypothetical protein
MLHPDISKQIILTPNANNAVLGGERFMGTAGKYLP